jgi:hypothetical protein
VGIERGGDECCAKETRIFLSLPATGWCFLVLFSSSLVNCLSLSLSLSLVASE